MDSVLEALKQRQLRTYASDLGRNAMDAEAMGANLGQATLTGSSQAYLAGANGLRAEAALETRPWRVSAAAETYGGSPTEARIALGYDLFDETRSRLSGVDSLRAVRDRIAGLRFSQTLLGRLKEAISLRLRLRRHEGEQEIRARISTWAEGFRADMAAIRDGGLLAGRVGGDLELTLLENEARAGIAGRLAGLDRITSETILGLEGDLLASIDLEWLAGRLNEAPVPRSYQAELDSLELEERRLVLASQSPVRKSLSVGPALRFLPGEGVDWNGIGLQVGFGYAFGRNVGSPALPRPPERLDRRREWVSLQDSAAATGVAVRLDSAISRSMRVAAIEPAIGYANLNTFIQQRIASALAQLDFQAAVGVHLVAMLERLSQLRGGACE